MDSTPTTSEIGRKGGKANSEAQKAARLLNLEKATKARAAKRANISAIRSPKQGAK